MYATEASGSGMIKAAHWRYRSAPPSKRTGNSHVGAGRCFIGLLASEELMLTCETCVKRLTRGAAAVAL